MTNGAAGIGLFVSRGVNISVPFVFPVKEKVIVSEQFEIRDLLYDMGYFSSYLVLHLTGKEARLFEGKINTLKEIKDDLFPKVYKDDYEYGRPSRGSSYVGEAFVKEYEKDKSCLKKVRYERFLKETDSELNGYLSGSVKLIISGVTEDLAQFKKHTRHSDRIVAQLSGNYTHKPLRDLSGLSWEAICADVSAQKQDMVRNFEDLLAKGQAISGLPNIWKAALEGRGYRLLVEKDFILPGFISDTDSYHLHLKPPPGPHLVLPDAINTLMETILKKSGEIVMVENNVLAAYDHVGLVTRY